MGIRARAARYAAACLLVGSATVGAQDEAAEATLEAGTDAEVIAVEPLREASPAPEPAIDDGLARLDTIEVTGSRIRRADYETAQPVFVLSREDIERSGLTDISEILRNITAAGNNSLTGAQGRFALTQGETNLDLRNLGANHTLLLVNGRRWVTGLIPTQTSVSDYNTIPTAIIERVEILKDGASAIYGSDAIGGVVNVITRKDFDGGDLSYHVGQFFEQGDGTAQQLSLSWGMNRPLTNLFMNFSYTDQAEAPNENRSFTARPSAGPTRDSIVTPNALLRFVELDSRNALLYGCPNLQAGIAAGALGGSPLGGPVQMTSMIPAGLVLCDLTLNPGAEGGAGNPLDYHQIDRSNPDDVYNRFADGTLKQPNERIAFFTQLNQQVFERMHFNFEGLYNRRESTSVGQNAYLGGGNLDGGALGYLAHISASNPNNPFAQDIGWDSTCGGPADAGGDPNSPTCTGIGDGSGAWAIRRGPGLNNQSFYASVETIRAGGGFSGDFDLFSQLVFWDAGYIYSRSRIEENLPSVNYELAGIALGNFGTCDGDCAPLNVFQGSAGLTQAAIDFILTDNWQRNRTQQEIAYLNFSTELPVLDGVLAGPLAVAVGGEFRREEFESEVDDSLQRGLVRMNLIKPLGGRTYAREAYMEFGVPLLKDAPLAQALDLELAGRYSHYPRIGAVTTGKAGLRWQPVSDLMLRATYSTGFRAPSIGELYLGESQSYDPLSDPCADPGADPTADANCLQDGTPGGGSGSNVATPYDLWQGNPDLEPERSRNLTYGLIFSPRWVTDLNFSVDFYNIVIDDFVVIGQGQFFLDSCYKTEQRNYCDYIHRDATGTLTYIDTPYFNLAKVETAGVDFGIDYALPMADYGRLKLRLEASYLEKFESTAPRPGQEDEVTSEVGTVDGQFFGYPRWKAAGYLSWEVERFTASWTTRMAYHMTEPCGDLFPTPSLKDLGLCSNPDVVDADGNPAPENRLHTLFYHHVQLSYDFADYDAEIAIGVNNVFDQDPRVSRSLASLYWYNYDPNHYDAPGRFGYLRAGFRF
ncbi:MAG: TonB-dependent receptor domain-containing protein [Sinimarinibacterium flocculans]|uniref:Iron complex outermembrane receptor protein n=1 Tax=Sinimarinibacterium flocculans TaxID=985250 RepID=A0A318EAJ2_9GAMM|nr:TonB-dependent receptor [Sinimarinibacterium flocculans]PXV69491.1 iron complex outermembrane receptor protein [Sinimarinibacterium flocculans]